jgi:hypothetical protein
MNFGLRFIMIASIAGVLAWAASAAPLQPTGDPQSEGSGYGYGAAKVTLCHIPPGNPANAHTITVGAPAVPAHLAHGDTLGPCPEVLAATAPTGKKAKKAKAQVTEESATEQTSTGKSKKQKPENASAGKQEKTKPDNGAGNATAGTQEKTKPGTGKAKKNDAPTVESSTTEQVSAAPAPQQKPKKPKEKPAHSNGVGQGSSPTTGVSSPGNENGHGNGNGGGNENGGGNGNGKGNGKSK